MTQAITDAIRSALNDLQEFVPLQEIRFTGNEAKYVQECIESTHSNEAGHEIVAKVLAQFVMKNR